MRFVKLKDDYGDKIPKDIEFLNSKYLQDFQGAGDRDQRGSDSAERKPNSHAPSSASAHPPAPAAPASAPAPAPAQFRFY